MRNQWHLPDVRAAITTRRVETVLVEYDEPEIATLRDDHGARYLAVAVDDEDDTVRWVHAVLDSNEYDALLGGSMTIRAALDKPRVWIVDVTRDGDFIAAWDVPFSDLGDEVLPEPDAFLPRASRARLRPTRASSVRPIYRRTIPSLAAPGDQPWG